ncbi:MAG: helix-turn-helix domain-containing protein [Candidatus Woesearchaeota archaeon]
MQKQIVESASLALLSEGFTVKTLSGPFEIIARDSERILFVKVLEDANSISEVQAEEFRKISSCLNVPIIIVANKAGTLLKDGVVYERFGITTMNLKTLKRCLKGENAVIKRSKAGLTVTIDPEKLRQARIAKGISIGQMSEYLGVSRKMVLEYESGKSSIILSRAEKLYRLFGSSVFKREGLENKPLEEYPQARSVFARKYSALGFSAVETRRMPFDLIAKREKKQVILTKLGDKPSPVLTGISRLIGAARLAIVDRHKPKDVPSLTKKEFMEFEDAAELLKFIQEFEEEHGQ